MLDRPVPDAMRRTDSAPAATVRPARRGRAVGARLVVPALAAACAVLMIAGEGARLDVADLTTTYALGSLLTGVLIAGTVGVLATGQGTLLLALVCLVASTAAHGALGAASLCCAVVAVVVAAALAVVAARDRSRIRGAAAPFPVVAVPTATTSLRTFRRLGPVVLGLTAAGLAVAAFGGWLWQHDARAADAFRARAVVVPGTVVAVNDDDYWSKVRLADGTTIRVPINDGGPRRGEHVDVRYDRASGRAELTGDVFDPTGAAALLGLGTGVAGWALGVGVVRRRRRLRALHGPGLVVDVDPRTDTSVRLVVAGVPVAEADGLRRADLEHPVDRRGAGAADPDAADPDAADFDDEDADDLARLAGLTDDELLHRLRLWGAPDAPVPPGDGERVPSGTGVVVGLGADGGGVAIRDSEGRWWLARTTRRPRTVRAVDLGAHRHATGTAGDPRSDAAPDLVVRDDTTPDATERALHGRTAAERFWGRVDRGAGHATVPALRATASWLPWLLGPVVALLQWWFQSGDEGIDWWGAIVLAVTLAGVAHAWARIGEPVVTWSSRGLGVAGVVVRHRIPWTAVRSVVADDDHLVVRLTLPGVGDDVVVVPREAPRYLAARLTDPRAARNALEAVRLDSVTGRVDHGWLAPVTRSAAVAGWWLLCGVAGVVVAAAG